MNAFERYMGTVRRQPVDVIPRVPILMQFAAEHIGSNYGAFTADAEVLVRANEICAADFGIDQLSAISDPYRETSGFGGAITYVRDGVPRCTAPLADARDLTRLASPRSDTSPRMADRLRAVAAYADRHRGAYSILGWVEGPAAEAATLRGTTNFLLDLYDDPDFVEALMDRCLEVGIAFARAQIEAGADTIGIGDAICSQIRPVQYERLILPREKRLVDAIHEAGGLVKMHICGNITRLLPGLATLGLDILDVDHMVDLATVRRAVGDEVVLTGNLDPVGAIRHGSPDAIRAAVHAAHAAAGNPYMVNAGCEIPSGTPVANLLALCEPIPWNA